MVVVSWCFELSQLQENYIRAENKLQSIFNLYNLFYKLSYYKSLFLKPQLKLCPHFHNANLENMFWSLFTFREPLTREPASIVCNNEQGDLFYSAGPHSNRRWPQPTQGKLGRCFGKMQVNGPER